MNNITKKEIKHEDINKFIVLLPKNINKFIILTYELIQNPLLNGIINEYIIYNIHDSIYYFKLSPTYGSNASCLLLFIATDNLLWNFRDVPVILRGNIFPWSFKNLIKKSGSL